MRKLIALILTVIFLLACNFLFPTKSAPSYTSPATKSIQKSTQDPSIALIGYTETRLHPKDGDLSSLLAIEAQKAMKLGQLPVVEFDASWCPPCQAINKSLEEKNELMLKAYDGVYIIKLDVDEWGWGVDGYKVEAIPVYFKLDSKGQATGEVIDGGAWNEDIPENIAPVMDQFFHTP
jgi:thiol-disulfide isomerase/thioredoxin